MSRKPPKPMEQIIGLAKQRGVIRVKDVTERGLHPEYLRRLCKQGTMRRTGRGLYMLTDREFSEQLDLAEAARRVPNGVICLFSALHFHEVGTQLPYQVWMMINRRAHTPRVDNPPMRFMRASGRSLTEGVEHHTLEGIDVPIYSIAKTVADCFKYRNKVGLEVAIEALRDCRKKRRCTNDELWHFAGICRVSQVMRPYMEAVA